MFTSVTDKRHALILWDLLATLFCALFGAVYEAFSHGVYSYGMLYAFAFPLTLGVLPLFLILMFGAPYPNRIVRSLQQAGIAALTVGSLVSGALEIYGTTSPLTVVYWILGGALILAAIAAYLIRFARKREA